MTVLTWRPGHPAMVSVYAWVVLSTCMHARMLQLPCC
jgi:hypothetical protein